VDEQNGNQRDRHRLSEGSLGFPVVTLGRPVTQKDVEALDDE
jgi:hypothetical protein